MTSQPIRTAFETWPSANERLRDAVAGLTSEQLAIQPAPERWPLWASIGHLACQRVFWLCDFAGAPGADTTPFPDAAFNCPGDDDLEHVLDASQLAAALDSTFRIVEHCLDNWTLDSLADVIDHAEWDGQRTHSRGWVVTRVFAHDHHHVAELNEALGRAGVSLIDLW